MHKSASAIALCFLVAVLDGFDIQAFGVAAPLLVEEFALSPSQQGWAASAAMLGLVFGAFFGGWSADRIGRRPVLLISVLWFGGFSIATAFASGYESLLLVRFLAGLGFGGAAPNIIAIASEVSSRRHRALIVTVVYCGMPAGAAIAALVTRLWGADFEWRHIFLMGGFAPVLVSPAVYFLLPETRPANAAASHGMSVLDALFRERRCAPTLLVWLIFIITLLVVHVLLNWLPTLIAAKGLPRESGSMASVYFNLMSIVGALLLAALVDRVGFRWPLTLTYAGLAVSMYFMATINDPSWLMVMSGCTGLLGFGPQCALYALISNIYPRNARGIGAGAAVGMGRFGSIAGPAIAGLLRSAGFSADRVFMFIAPVALIAAIAVSLLGSLVEPSAGDASYKGARRRGEWDAEES